MAYINQERKAKIAPVVKTICKKFGVKARLSVRNHSTLILNIAQGDIDFIGNWNKVVGANTWHVNRGWKPATDHLNVNTYHFKDQFDGSALQFLKEVHNAMMTGNHDHSDIQTDYFDVGWYVDINIGRWDKPYALVK